MDFVSSGLVSSGILGKFLIYSSVKSISVIWNECIFVIIISIPYVSNLYQMIDYHQPDIMMIMMMVIMMHRLCEYAYFFLVL